MSTKFLLISQVFYPDQVSTANLYTGLCARLVENDIHVEAWTAHPSYTDLKRQPARLNYKGIDIRVLPSTNFSKKSFAGRILNTLTFSACVIVRLLLSSDKTPVWTHTTPPLTGILLSFVCSVKKRKFIYILLDIFPEGLIRLGKLSGKNPFVNIWKKAFKEALKRSHKIVVIGRDICKLVETMSGDLKQKLEYIPHWQDERLIHPMEYNTNQFIIEHDLADKFVVQYAGNMGLWNEVSAMGRVAGSNLKDVAFVFTGDGIRKRELLEEMDMQNRENVFFFDFQLNENFNTMLNASHVQLVTLRAGLEGIAVPSKIYGILAAGKPVIALVPDQSEVACVVREENCGFVVDPGDHDGLFNSVSILKADENLRKQFSLNSRAAFEKKYTLKIAAEKYISLLSGLIQA